MALTSVSMSVGGLKSFHRLSALATEEHGVVEVQGFRPTVWGVDEVACDVMGCCSASATGRPAAEAGTWGVEEVTVEDNWCGLPGVFRDRRGVSEHDPYTCITHKLNFI